MLATALAYPRLLFLGIAVVIGGIAKLVDRTERRDRSLLTIGRQTLIRKSR
jgi:hypothetical protein